MAKRKIRVWGDARPETNEAKFISWLILSGRRLLPASASRLSRRSSHNWLGAMIHGPEPSRDKGAYPLPSPGDPQDWKEDPPRTGWARFMPDRASRRTLKSGVVSGPWGSNPSYRVVSMEGPDQGPCVTAAKGVTHAGGREPPLPRWGTNGKWVAGDPARPLGARGGIVQCNSADPQARPGPQADRRAPEPRESHGSSIHAADS